MSALVELGVVRPTSSIYKLDGLAANICRTEDWELGVGDFCDIRDTST